VVVVVVVVVMMMMMMMMMVGCGYRGVGDATCSAITLRRRRDEWIIAGVALVCATMPRP
jgi:hypothetical protein